MGSLSLKVCFFAILCTVIGVLIKQWRPEFSPFVKIASTVSICAMAVSVIMPLITYLNSIFSGSDVFEKFEYVGNIAKALGIAVLTQICADICRDCGESSAANGVELIGRVEMLLLCLPMLEAILATVREVLAW